MERIASDWQLPELKFFPLSLTSGKSRRIGDPPVKPVIVEPIVEPASNEFDAKQLPEVVFQDHTAIFRFSTGEALLVHWPLAEQQLPREDFERFCMQQAISLRAQLFLKQSDIRVFSFDLSTRRTIYFNDRGEKFDKSAPGLLSDVVYDTSRYTVPTSTFESVLLGGAERPYGILVK